jgi:subtilisin family serine protease
MAKKRLTQKPVPTQPPSPPPGSSQADARRGSPHAEYTGRSIVVFRDIAPSRRARFLKEVAAFSNVASAADFDNSAMVVDQVSGADAVIFDEIGVAVVTPDPSQLNALHVSAEEDSPILVIEPEQVMYAIGVSPIPGVVQEYLRGYRDAVVTLYDRVAAGSGSATVAEAAGPTSFTDDEASTWGLKATDVVASKPSGRNVTVAVLDTGLDLNHPDFVGRNIVSQSFVTGQPVQDGHGHGTHCIGTACGPLRPGTGPRYGCAHGARIFAGKVLNNLGRGEDLGIFAGINWAVANKCQVISMSLGAPTAVGDHYPRSYEIVARRALAAGTLIVAAAGNESRRELGLINPVGRPANCPSIIAVAAIDSQLGIATFSNRGLNPDGGQVDIAAPGVGVYSTWPLPTRYRTISGTSMATPHVAGIAAMHAEATNTSGSALWQTVLQHARRLTLPSADVGVGLVQAPK